MEGLRTYVDFDLIEIADNTIPYLTLLGIGWEMENLVDINFKKRKMAFKNHYTRVISPLDLLEGHQYVEPIKDKFDGVWDHSYNVCEYYINPTIDCVLGWQSIISMCSNSNKVLEN